MRSHNILTVAQIHMILIVTSRRLCNTLYYKTLEVMLLVWEGDGAVYCVERRLFFMP